MKGHRLKVILCFKFQFTKKNPLIRPHTHYLSCISPDWLAFCTVELASFPGYKKESGYEGTVEWPAIYTSPNV